MSNSQMSIDQATPTIKCGTLVATGTGINGYSPLLPKQGCRAVWFNAPTLATPGGKVNASPVLFGDATVQNDYIAADGSRDRYIQIDSPDKIFLKFGSIGDMLEYRIET